jgi:hypothetical protein
MRDVSLQEASVMKTIRANGMAGVLTGDMETGLS